MNPIHKKRVKREKKIAPRIKCHGSRMTCWNAHGLLSYINKRRNAELSKTIEAPEIKYLPEEKKPEKRGFFKRMFAGA